MECQNQKNYLPKQKGLMQVSGQSHSIAPGLVTQSPYDAQILQSPYLSVHPEIQTRNNSVAWNYLKMQWKL